METKQGLNMPTVWIGQFENRIMLCNPIEIATSCLGSTRRKAKSNVKLNKSLISFFI